jgi:hypothetical protein
MAVYFPLPIPDKTVLPFFCKKQYIITPLNKLTNKDKKRRLYKLPISF